MDIRQLRTLALPLAVVVVGSALSIYNGRYEIRSIHRQAKSVFERFCDQIKRETELRGNRTVYGLKGERGVFAASKSVERDEIKAYVDSRNLPKEFPGAIGMGYIKKVERKNLDEFVNAERADNAPDFKVKTSGNRDLMYVITDVYPLKDNAPAWGYDVGSEETRLEAVNRAIETGQPAMTGRIELVQDENKEPGFLYLVPIFKNGMRTETPAQRENAIQGFTYSPIVLSKLFAGVMDAAQGYVDVEIYDGKNPSKSNLMYDAEGFGVEEADPSHANAMFSEVDPIGLGGRTWTLILRSTPTFEATVNYWGAYLTMGAGIVVSTLTALAIFLLGYSKERAVKLADEMTADLSQAKSDLEQALRESESILGALDTQTIVTIADPDGNITYVNGAFERISGYSREEVVGHSHNHSNSGVHPKEFWTDLWGTITAGRSWRGDVCNRRKDGSLYWVDMIVTPFMGADGRVEKYFSFRTDISARRADEEKLVKSEAFMARAGQVARVGAWEVDLVANTVYFSDESCEIHEVEPGFSPQLDEFLETFYPDNKDKIAVDLMKCIEARETFDMVLPLTTAKGNKVWVRAVGECNYQDGRPDSITGAVQDMTKQKLAEDAMENYVVQITSQIDEISRAKEQLEFRQVELGVLNDKLHRMATEDTLTGMANRREFTDQAKDATAAAEESGQKVGILFLDLDNFKHVNDSLGHEAGDQLLIQVGERICANVGEGDLPARLGGDEFAVLLRTEEGVREAEQIADAIVKAMRQPFNLVGNPITATCSLGVAVGEAGISTDDLTRNADIAMYHAKNAGKSAWSIFDDTMLKEALDQVEMETAIVEAWESKAFRIAYLPEVNIQTGRTVGVEALLRWEHPTKGIVSAEQTVALAKKMRVSVPLGNWVMEEACRALASWNDDGSWAEISLSVNVSYDQVSQPDFVATTLSILAKTGVKPEQLCLELSENVLTKNFVKLEPVLAQLRTAGIRITMDDFGTGNLAITGIEKYDVSSVKIHESFVSRLGEDLTATSIMRTLVNLCNSIHLNMQAEGVDDFDKLVQLQAVGVSVAQGYFFAQPMSADEFVAWRTSRAECGSTDQKSA